MLTRQLHQCAMMITFEIANNLAPVIKGMLVASGSLSLVRSTWFSGIYRRICNHNVHIQRKPI